MMRVMSFNIRTASANDDIHGWDSRKERVLSRIRAFEPDLLGLQECRDDAQAEFLKNNLPDYQFHGAPRGGGDGTSLEMAPLFFRASSFDLIQAGHFWLSDTPRQAGSKGWDAVFARTASWVLLHYRPTSQAFVFLNTHFDYQPVAIMGSAHQLRQWTEEILLHHPVILCGDFNADKHSAAFYHLTAGGLLTDVHRQMRPDGGDEPTFHAFGQPEAEAAIDWILVSQQFDVFSASVDATRDGSLYPSDHYPVTAKLEFKEE